MIGHASLVFALTFLLPTVSAVPTRQFDLFFPGWNGIVQNILNDTCASQLADYKGGEADHIVGGSSRLVTPVIDCILSEFPEFRKAELAASAVILGSLPTILQSLGSSTAEGALIGLRRPALAFLLAAGSPAVATGKAAEFVEIVGKYVAENEEPGAFVLPGVKWDTVPVGWWWVMSVGEYLFVGGAVANVIHLAYRLGVNAVVVFAPETIFMVPLWTFLAALIHVGGVVALALRVRTMAARTESDTYNSKTLLRRIPDELVPLAFQTSKPLVWRKENVFFHALSWIISVGAVIHIVIGTLTLSSLLFFSVTDAILVVARYIGSAIVCRAVIRLELSGLRAAAQRVGVDRTEEEVELTTSLK